MVKFIETDIVEAIDKYSETERVHVCVSIGLIFKCLNRNRKHIPKKNP